MNTFYLLTLKLHILSTCSHFARFFLYSYKFLQQILFVCSWFFCFTVYKNLLSVLCISLKQLYIYFSSCYTHTVCSLCMCGVITNLMELLWFMLCVSIANLDFQKKNKTKSSEFGLKYRCVAQYFSLFFSFRKKSALKSYRKEAIIHSYLLLIFLLNQLHL